MEKLFRLLPPTAISQGKEVVCCTGQHENTAYEKHGLLRLYFWLCQLCCHLFIYNCISYKVQWCNDVSIWTMTCSRGICDPCHMSQQHTGIHLSLCPKVYSCLIELIYPEWPTTQDADVTHSYPALISLVVPATPTPAGGGVFQATCLEGRYAYKTS